MTSISKSRKGITDLINHTSIITRCVHVLVLPLWPAYPSQPLSCGGKMTSRWSAGVLHQCAGCSSGPCCQDHHHFGLSPGLARTTLLGQSSNVRLRLGGALGAGNGKWFHIALSSQFFIKCNMFSQVKSFFFGSPRPFWLFWLFYFFGTIKGTDAEMGKGRGDLNLSSVLTVLCS